MKFRRRDEELNEEIRSHLRMAADDRVERGETPEQADAAARREFGNVGLVKEVTREMWGWARLRLFLQDVKYGLRTMRRGPGFTAVAVATLALAIGANTAIFSVVNAVLLRPLPYRDADELTALYVTNARAEFEWPFTPAAYLQLKGGNTVFADVAALSNKGWPANLTGDGEPERLQGFQVSANLFRVLGAEAARGRTFLDEEDRPGSNRVVVISDELWRRRFGGSPDVLGRPLMLNSLPFVVVGVMPPDFRFYAKTDVWTPLAFTPSDEADDQNGYLIPVARRGPGVSNEQARAEVENLYRARLDDPKSDRLAGLKSLQSIMTQNARPILLTLFAAVGFVLLIACANVANLLLARGGARRRELAVRAALGARRLRLMRQLLVESAMLAVAGGVCGLILASWCTDLLVAGLPESLVASNSHVAGLRLDSSALAFTFGLALLTTVAFGLLPAWQASKVNLNDALKEGGRGDTQGARQSRLRSWLVVAEMALAMILLAGAGLMVKSFWRLSQTDPGFDPSGALTAQIDPAGDKYKELEQVVGFYRQLLERVGAVPGVRHVGIINSLDATTPVSVDEHPPVEPEQRPQATTNQVGGDYFRAMGIPLRKGRFFDERDVKGATPVVVVDETLARRHFPDEDPLGKHLRVGETSREIVGVVGATRRYNMSAEPFPRVYLPYQQENWWSMTLVVRSQAGDPMALAPAVRRELAAVDKDQPIHGFRRLEESVSEWLTPQRFSTLLLTAFAVMAAALAAVGIYGVVSYSVTQRRHEIGVRVALGARRRDVLKLVIREGMTLVLAGLGLGLGAAFALTRVMKALLYGVGAADPATYVGVTVLLAAVAFVACVIPALRATRVDPMTALKYE